MEKRGDKRSVEKTIEMPVKKIKTNSTNDDDDVFIGPKNKNENIDKLVYEEFNNLYTRKMC